MDTRGFHDELAAHYDLMYADWDASITRQGKALDALPASALGPGPHTVLDNACGIGTQALGLALGDGRFDAVVCADNALPHLLTAEDVRAALAETRRVPRPGGLLLLSTRPYGELRRTRPASEAPRVRTGPDGRTGTPPRRPASTSPCSAPAAPCPGSARRSDGCAAPRLDALVTPGPGAPGLG